jgi:hypothetical protein
MVIAEEDWYPAMIEEDVCWSMTVAAKGSRQTVRMTREDKPVQALRLGTDSTM